MHFEAINICCLCFQHKFNSPYFLRKILTSSALLMFRGLLIHGTEQHKLQNFNIYIEEIKRFLKIVFDFKNQIHKDNPFTQN